MFTVEFDLKVVFPTNLEDSNEIVTVGNRSVLVAEANATRIIELVEANGGEAIDGEDGVHNPTLSAEFPTFEHTIAFLSAFLNTGLGQNAGSGGIISIEYLAE